MDYLIEQWKLKSNSRNLRYNLLIYFLVLYPGEPILVNVDIEFQPQHRVQPINPYQWQLILDILNREKRKNVATSLHTYL